MNSWDEDPDELLRRRWQQTFADFEVQPQTSLSRRILNQFPTRNRRKRAYWLVGGLVLLLAGAGLVYKTRIGQRPALRLVNIITKSPSTLNHPPLAGGIRQPKVSYKRFASPELPNETGARRRSSNHPPAIFSEKIGETPGLPGNRISTERVFTTKTTYRRRVGLEQFPAIAAEQLFSATHRSTTPRFSSRSSGRKRNVPIALESERTKQVTGGGRSPLSDPYVATTQRLASEGLANWTQLKPLGVTLMISSLPSLHRQLPGNGLAPFPPSEAATTHPGSQHWFVEAVPLSSFQWMSTPPASSAYLSQVSTPAAFSPATWGYQINGGMRWHRWQAHLSVGQLRRWAYYTVSENRYRVEPSPTDPTKLVRETYTVTENVSLPMVGAGLSRLQFLSQGRYMVDLGGEVAYLPTSGQSLTYLRGGASRRLSLNRQVEGLVGLSVEYGLNRLLTEQQQLVIRPLVVGIRLRIQPRSGHQ